MPTFLPLCKEKGKKKKLSARYLITTSLQTPIKSQVGSLKIVFPPLEKSAGMLRLPSPRFTLQGDGGRAPPGENLSG